MLDVFDDVSRGVEGARETLRGFPGASPEAHCVAVRNQSARSAFRWYLESLVWQGRWGSTVAATSRQGSSRTPHRPGIPGYGSEAMAVRFRYPAGTQGGQPPKVSVYPTDRIRGGSWLSPRVRGSGQSGLVELRSPRRSAHNGGDTGVSKPSVRSPRSPRLGAISVFASRSPVRLSVGRGWGSLRPASRPRRSARDDGKRLPARRLVAALASRRPGW
jgi:hypothetical protein